MNQRLESHAEVEAIHEWEYGTVTYLALSVGPIDTFRILQYYTAAKFDCNQITGNLRKSQDIFILMSRSAKFDCNQITGNLRKSQDIFILMSRSAKFDWNQISEISRHFYFDSNYNR